VISTEPDPDLALDLANTRLQLERARTLAAHLEAENHQLTQAAHQLIANYAGDICDDTTTCDCALAHLTRLLSR